VARRGRARWRHKRRPVRGYLAWKQVATALQSMPRERVELLLLRPPRSSATVDMAMGADALLPPLHAAFSSRRRWSPDLPPQPLLTAPPTQPNPTQPNPTTRSESRHPPPTMVVATELSSGHCCCHRSIGLGGEAREGRSLKKSRGSGKL
jgi:hypothetical protein